MNVVMKRPPSRSQAMRALMRVRMLRGSGSVTEIVREPACAPVIRQSSGRGRGRRRRRGRRRGGRRACVPEVEDVAAGDGGGFGPAGDFQAGDLPGFLGIIASCTRRARSISLSMEAARMASTMNGAAGWRRPPGRRAVRSGFRSSAERAVFLLIAWMTPSGLPSEPATGAARMLRVRKPVRRSLAGLKRESE
jgi:hypothetical protein